MPPKSADDFLVDFGGEAVERADRLSDLLLRWESSPGDPALATEMMREFHTIKGGARMVGFESLRALAHRVEDVLHHLSNTRRPIPQAMIDALLLVTDHVRVLATGARHGRRPELPEDARAALELFERAATGDGISGGLAGADTVESVIVSPSPPPAPAAPESAPAPASVPARTPAPAAAADTIRVDVEKLDQLAALAGDVHIRRLEAEEQLRAAGSLRTLSVGRHSLLDRVRHGAKQHDDGSVTLSLDGALALDALGEQDRSYDRALGGFVEGLGEQVARLSLQSDELIDEVDRIRLQPMGTLYRTLPRAVRDMARDAGKQIRLELAGESTRIDRKLVEALSEPINHLVRNSLAHGIEAPEERVAVGKPPEGVIRIDAREENGRIALTISDDGRGIDIANVITAAVRRDIIDSARAAQLTPDQALELIYHPGLSTKSSADDVAGRGIGMHAVRAAIQHLAGTSHVHSELGRGCTFTLTLPPSVSSLHALLVRCGTSTYAVASRVVDRIVRLRAHDVQRVAGSDIAVIAGRTMSVLRLASSCAPAESAPVVGSSPALIVNVGEQGFAILVDEVIHEEEVVGKPLGPFLAALSPVDELTVLGNGRVAAILDANDLRPDAPLFARAPAASQEAKGSRALRVLVVEDSAITAELEQHILAAEGHDVTVAPNGRDAMELLDTQAVDLVVTDVDMPHCDGIELTRWIRTQPRLAQLPVIILSSREDPAERALGADAGANAYLAKSSFEPRTLVETIERVRR